MRKFSDQKIDWQKIFEAMNHPKLSDGGEEYIDVSERELEAVNAYTDFLLSWRYVENPHLPVADRRKADKNFQDYASRQFAYLNRGKLVV